MRLDLSDEEWAVIEPLLPTGGRGPKRTDDRRILNVIFYILRTGAPWRDLPERYGPRTTVYNHPVERHARGNRPLDHAPCNGRFGRKAACLRDMGLCHASGRLRPGLRQIKRPVDEAMAMTRDISSKDADLAVGNLARRSGVLASDTTRRLALLEEPGFINDQNRIRIGQRLKRVIA